MNLNTVKENKSFTKFKSQTFTIRGPCHLKPNRLKLSLLGI